MQGEGYVTLEKNDDQRVRNVQLSASGEKVLEIALPLWEEAQEKVVRQFGEENLKVLLRSMKEFEKIVE